jgi:hypothetical protein
MMMKKTQEDLPTPRDLLATPQLAILSVLETTLEMVICSLLAEHLDIFDDEKPYWVRADLSSAMAEEILSDIQSLRTSMEGYRFMLAAEMEKAPEPDDGFPF